MVYFNSIGASLILAQQPTGEASSDTPPTSAQGVLPSPLPSRPLPIIDPAEIIRNFAVRAQGSFDPATVAYLDSIIPGDASYSQLGDQRPLTFTFFSYPEGEPFRKRNLQAFPGYNQVGEEEGSPTVTLLPLGERPRETVSSDIKNSHLNAQAESPVSSLIDAVKNETDILDLMAGMVRWIKGHVSYRLNDDHRSMEQVLQEGWGDCDDVNQIVKEACDQLGIECQSVEGAFFEPDFKGHTGWVRHAWNMVKVGEAWVPVDAVLGEEGQPKDGDELWAMAQRYLWIPFTDRGMDMDQWNRLVSIKLNETIGVINFDTVEVAWNAVGDVVDKLHMSPAALRTYLQSQGLGNVVSDDFNQNQKIYLDVVLAQWLGTPETVGNPLEDLACLHQLLVSKTWSDEVRADLEFSGMTLLTFALTDAENERDQGETSVIISADDLYQAYQTWKEDLPEPEGYTGLVLEEWERRLGALYAFDQQPVPEDLFPGSPKNGGFLPVLCLIREGKTPEELRSTTLAYAVARRTGIPDFTEDAELTARWIDDLELQWAESSDVLKWTSLYDAMKTNQGDESADGAAFKTAGYSYARSDNQGMSILALIDFRKMATRELNRRLEVVSGGQLDRYQLDETLTLLDFIYRTHLTERVITDARAFVDLPPPEKKENSLSQTNFSTALYIESTLSKAQMMQASIKWSQAREVQLSNERGVQERLLVDLDQKSSQDLQDTLKAMDLLAQGILALSQNPDASSTRIAWCQQWLERYCQITGAPIPS